MASDGRFSLEGMQNLAGVGPTIECGGRSFSGRIWREQFEGMMGWREWHSA
jgi:hypothetical protein